MKIYIYIWFHVNTFGQFWVVLIWLPLLSPWKRLIGAVFWLVPPRHIRKLMPYLSVLLKVGWHLYGQHLAQFCFQDQPPAVRGFMSAMDWEWTTALCVSVRTKSTEVAAQYKTFCAPSGKLLGNFPDVTRFFFFPRMCMKEKNAVKTHQYLRMS